VQRELRDVPGVTVLIYDQVCAAEKRRRRKRGAYPVSDKRAFINELVCEGCGDCSAVSNCISIEPQETQFGRKRRINQSSCNTDLSCIKGFCPSFVTVEGGSLRKPVARTQVVKTDDLPQPTLNSDFQRPYSMLLAGIGGTGVITVSAILAQAAHLDGLALLTLDQTGLAQKNGAHIRIGKSPDQLHSVRIGPGESDLVLGFDIVVSASASSLSTFSKGRTHAVLDDHFAPTASFVKDTTIDFRQGATLKALRYAAGEEAVSMVAATSLATALIGDAIAANMLLLGNAWQRGLVPISLAAIDRAIELNGTGIAMNRAAFNWGRRSAADATAVAREAGLEGAAAVVEEGLGDIVAKRIDFLTAYQNASYARRYSDLVALAERAEKSLPGKTGFAEAVARNAFKLMAYKDEYEVARLHRDQSFHAKLAEQFEGDFRIKHHLAPPMIARTDPRTGKPGKMAFGGWIRPVFAVLEQLKFLRGTSFDPFGRTAERKMERKLITDYVALIEAEAATLDVSSHATAVELANLPDEIRGFGHVKHASIERFEKRKTSILSRLPGQTLHNVA
jgi:indolepyruvate ferredoxin oxidoreductase